MATIKLLNQQPIDFTQIDLNPKDLNIPYEDDVDQNVLTPLIDHIFTPNQPSQTVSLLKDGQNVDQNTLKNEFAKDLQNPDIDYQLQENLSKIIHQVSRYRSQTTQRWQNVIGNALLLKQKQPLPSNQIIYTYDTDIQNQAKDYLKNRNTINKQALLNGLFGVLLSQPITQSWKFVLIDQKDYDQFKDELTNLLNQKNVSADIQKQNQDLINIGLDQKHNFTSWMINDHLLNHNEGITRYMLHLINHHQAQSTFESLPISLKTELDPVGISFINLDHLANSTQFEFRKELNQLTQVTNKLIKFKFAKLKQIKSVNTISFKKQRQKSYNKTQDDYAKRLSQGFGRNMPTMKQQIKRLITLVKHHQTTMQSQNSYRTNRYTYMRPNRRHPNNPNLKGHINQIHYRPDVHIYLDTSGSISEDQYKSAVTMLIQLAQKLKSNLYFTSFSHIISQPTKIAIQGRSLNQIYQAIQSIPKVAGGTEYEQVWQAIDQTELYLKAHHRAQRLNFIITDFEYDLRSSFIPNLNHASTTSTYYLPMASNQYEYNNVRNDALDFSNSLLQKHDLQIKNRILM